MIIHSLWRRFLRKSANEPQKAMTLVEAQREFALDVSYLIQYIFKSGYTCTFGDAYRSPKAFGGQGEKGPYGENRSSHKQRLAVDLNLFKDGKYLMNTEDHKPIGKHWKTLHPDNRWGGDFSNPDGNHYSKRYGGIA